MAIKPGYKSFTFDGKNSGNYGIYITGSAVYNAPEREVEMIEIPGRNGAFALDKGRFRNIEVTYPAGIYAESQEDFAQALSDLRNMLASRKGYCRLTDEYNPEEYRMAVYKSGLDVDPVAFQRAGEFDITFECKPQRFLTSGEEAVSITSGDTITNPTLFEAGPLLEILGGGTININGAEIERADVPIGDVVISPAIQYTNVPNISRTLDVSQLNIGDRISVTSVSAFIYNVTQPNSHRVTNASITSAVNASASANYVRSQAIFEVNVPALFTYGTTQTITATVGVSVRFEDNATYTGTLGVTIAYDGISTITINATMSTITRLTIYQFATYLYPIIGTSTKSSLTKPTFIDLDIGEAYIIENDEIVSVNDAVELPAALPTLAPGANTITYDNTITNFKITPRWWKV